MEKAFIVSKEFGFGKDLKDYCNKSNQRRKQVTSFFKLNNIQAKGFYLSGDGCCDCTFDEYEKKRIKLAIIPTIEDEHLLGEVLGKECEDKLRFLKRNSKLMKKFQQYCVDEEIIINLLRPVLWDYFKSFELEEFVRAIFSLGDVYYLKVGSENLKEDDIPEGMAPIKLSEFYIKLEEFREREGGK
ncbi:MAG: hypothetical protein RR942_01325 [Romboutsia sp.]